MPILNVQYTEQAQAADGTPISLPPVDVLIRRGPRVQVTVNVAQAMAAPLQQQGRPLPASIAG